MKDMDKKRGQVKSLIIVILALVAVAGIAIQSAELRKESICKNEYCYEKRVEGSVFCEKHKKEMEKKKIPDGKDYVNHSNSNSHQNADTNVNKNDSTTVKKMIRPTHIQNQASITITTHMMMAMMMYILIRIMMIIDIIMIVIMRQA